MSAGFWMAGYRYRPKMPLGALVECLWYWEGAPGPHLQERLLPQAQAAMILNLREEPIAIYEDNGDVPSYGTAVLSGARSNCFTIDCNQQERVVGVQFAPGGAFPFFRMPMSELEDASFDMRDLWGEEAAWVRERVLAAPTPRAMLEVLAACLAERLGITACVANPKALHPAVVYIAGELDICDGPGRVHRVTEKIGMSQRRVAQLFHEQVGVSPKTFHRVRRFQHTLTRLRGVRQVNWADLAVECGYFDQAHLSHDFRQIAGMTPSAYLAAATEHLNHVPMRD
ncbi:MAG TPA: helix-turn-helix domain-containing protein [Acidobacteriaceae bacterium]